MTPRARPSTAGANVQDLVDTDRELALLRELIQAASSGPELNRWPPRRPG